MGEDGFDSAPTSGVSWFSFGAAMFIAMVVALVDVGEMVGPRNPGTGRVILDLLLLGSLSQFGYLQARAVAPRSGWLLVLRGIIFALLGATLWVAYRTFVGVDS